MSMKLTPAAATSTTTSFSPGVGVGRSSTRSTSTPPGRVTITARMRPSSPGARPWPQLLRVAHRPDARDPVARELEREHGDGDAVLLADQAGLAVDRTLQDGEAGCGPADPDAGARDRLG